MTVYDYSDARPDPSSLGEGVMRYLAPVRPPWPSQSVGKVVGLDEIAALHAQRKQVGLVWEIGTNDCDGGYNRGLDYGDRARTMARTLAFPDSLPIYWAVDKRLNNATRIIALDYGTGFTKSAGVARPYGESALIDAAVNAGIADAGWGVATWDNTNSPYLALIQQVKVPDVPGTDMNTVMRPDWGGWHPDISPGGDVPLNDTDKAWIQDLLKGNGINGAADPKFNGNAAVTARLDALAAKVDPGVIADAVVAKLGGSADAAAIKQALVDVLRKGTG